MQKLNKMSLRHWMKEVLTPAISTEGHSPLFFGLLAQTVCIPSTRNLNLFGWFIPALVPQPWPTVVLLHGWCGNASSLLPAAQVLNNAGFAVLLLEARNHGRSDCDDHTSLPRFAEDLEKAIDWLKQLSSVDSKRIAALGHSVGAAAVLLAASRSRDLAAVVSVSAFAHPEQVMQRWFASRNVPYWPIAWLINRSLERIIGAVFSDIAPVKIISKIDCPVLLIHGQQDDVVPINDAHLICKDSNHDKTELIVCEGTHDAFEDAAAVTLKILTFFKEKMGSRNELGSRSETAVH